MRYSLLLAATAVTVSASVLRRADFSGAENLPDSAFPKFETVSLEDAKAGKDRKIQGLPEPDDETSTSKIQGLVTTATTEEAAACSASPNVHVEWRRASASDRQGFIDAVKCLMNQNPSGNFPPATNRYEDLVRLHQEFMPDVHNNAKFLPWHRYYLWTFEQVLRDECSFTGPMLWWDETLDAGNFGQSDIFSSSYFGSIPAPNKGQPVCVTNGAFAGLVLNIGPGSTSTPHCLSRSLNEAYSAQCSTAYITLCNQRADYADYESCLEYG